MRDNQQQFDRKSQILALRDAASAINAGSDLDTVLHELIQAACRHANWTIGSIMAIDVPHGYAYVVVRHDPTLIQRTLPDQWELATSPSLIALQRNQPVYIRDARVSEDYPGYRREAFERDYRTVLVMPMSCTDAQGRPMVLSVVSREITDVTEDSLAFLGTIVHLGEIAVEKQHRLRQEKLAAERLQSVLQAQNSLLQQALADASVPTLALRLNELLPNPVVVVDFTANLLVAGRSPDPAVYDDAAWRAATEATLGRQLLKAAREAADHPGADAQRLFLDDGANRFRIPAKIEPLTVDGEAVGALILFPTPNEFSDLDLLLLQSTKFAFSVLMMRSFIRFRAETRTLTELFLELVEGRWRDAGDIQQRARRQGVDLAKPAQLVVVDVSDKVKERLGTSIDLHHAAARLLQQNAVRATVVQVAGGLACLVPVEAGRKRDWLAKLMRRIAEDLARAMGEEPIVVLAGGCHALSDYQSAWERAWRIIRIARAFGRTGALTGEDFGPLPMLVAAADAEEVRRFVTDRIGALVAHDRAHGTPYLETLSAYVREGCRSQPCADAMGLHVTTLRYRLSRIQELFGIEVETADKRFAVELAIRLYGVIDNREHAQP